MLTDTKTLLLVDDEPANLQVLRNILSDQYRLLFAKDGERALELSRSEKPDLVLLDVMMPGMDGPQTLKALQQRPEGLNIPVIFMTARLQPSEIEEYRLLGAIGVIPKPFDPMTLADDIRRLVADNPER